MIINRTYTILMGRAGGTPVFYKRYIQPGIKLNDKIGYITNLLLPGDDINYKACLADMYVRTCWKSSLKQNMLTYDPQNTYTCWFDAPVAETTHGGLPTGLSVDLLEPSAEKTWIYKNILTTVDPVAGTANVAGVDYPLGWASSISAELPAAPGITLKLRGTLPGSTFSIVSAYTRPPTLNLASIVAALRAKQVTWLEPYSDWKNDHSTEDWLAAFVLNYCKTIEG